MRRRRPWCAPRRAPLTPLEARRLSLAGTLQAQECRLRSGVRAGVQEAAVKTAPAADAEPPAAAEPDGCPAGR